MSSRCLTMLAVVLCTCATAFGTISFSSNTLTYSSPSDLGTTIDPSGLKDVTNSYGITKSSFQALNPQVVAFNGAPSPTQTLRTLVVNYTASSTVTFTFPSAMYNYGSMSSVGRGAFSGSSAQDAISTVPTQPDSLYNWLDATITSTGGQGVQSIGFCAGFRNDQAVAAGQVLYTLSDATTDTVTLPALGGSGNPEYVFIGYTAPSGKTITRIQASRTSGAGGGWVTVDDLAFVMSADTTPPAAVSNLSCSNLTTTSVQLNWTAPGDDGSTGTATTYDIRYSTSAITAGNFSSATAVTGLPAPAAAGTNQNVTVSGLTADTTYYFAMKTADEVPNWSTISNVPSAHTVDSVAPAAVSNLSCSNLTTTSVQLNWTAPGDNGSSGTATTYDIRYSTSTITAGNFSSATAVTGLPAPAAAGTNQNVTVSGLTADTTYYFAMKTADEVPNWSTISNVPSAHTVDSVAPAAVSNLSCSNLTTTSVQLNWTAPGDNGSSGTATTYDIRYSTSTITAGNFSSATAVTGVPAPAAAGTNQNVTVSGLTADTTYYFAMKTADEVPNWSTISNVPSAHTVDSVAPAAVSNLATGSITASSITLSWTAPGDNGSTGTATSYDIRYSTSTITAGNFSSATAVTGVPAPAAAGTNQNVTVSGLSGDTTYYFAMKTADEVPNWSAISNVPSAKTSDTVAPAAVSNLATSSPTGTSITLSWTAPGDNGNSGTATTYDIRYSTSTITAANFSSATQVTGAPAPQVAGTNQNMVVSGLSPNTTYYFAMKTADEVPNWSAISNVPTGTTTAQTSTWTGSVSQSWSVAGNWNPATVPGAGMTGLINISSPYPITDADLSGAPTIQVATNGLVSHKSGVTLTTPVTLAGGTWRLTDSWGSSTLNAAVTVTAPSVMDGVRGTSLGISGALAGSALLTFRGTDNYLGDGPDWTISSSNNLFSGGILIDSGNNPNVWVNASRALGTGDITVRSTGTLIFGANQDYSGASRTPVLYLESGTISMTDHLSGATLPFGVVVQSVGGTLGAGTWATNCVYSGAVTLNGPLTLAGSRGNGGSVGYTITGQISGNNTVTLNTTDQYQGARNIVTLANATNNYTGGTVLQMGYLTATSEGALSTGPITLYTPDSWTRLYLDKATDANWTISNTLYGTGTIQVEGGSGFALNTSGTVSPGIGAGNVGTITVQGNLGFNTGATLAIDLNGTSTPVADLVAVSGNVSNLSNATLNISVTGNQNTISGVQFTILTCANDLTSQAFGNVTIPTGWTKTMAYGNGFVRVTLTLGSGDSTPPAAVSNLATSSPTNSSITLSWTAPGDDGNTGTATTYDIRYSTSTITAGNFSSATQVTGAPAPQVAGTNQSMTVSGLAASTTYYFAMKTADEVPNWSTISNVPSGTTTSGADTTPPAAVSNLATSSPTNTTITLTWTAPGDDGSTGTATTYDIRYSTSTINTGNWGSATQVSGEPAPLVAGTNQSMTITGLTANTTYYFAMKTADEVPNWSGLSNVPSGTTTNTSGNNNPVLSPKDFKYLGYYEVPRGGSFLDLNYGLGFTHRYVGGQLRFLTQTYDHTIGHRLIEFAAPGSLGGTVSALTNQWPDIWTGTGLTDGGVWIGLWYEAAQNRLWTTWAIDYPDDTQATYTKSLAVRTLNADGTISNAAGPWGLQGIGDRMIYGGVQAVPSWFQSTYSTGAYCAGWGGYASRATSGQTSLGPTLFTFPEPTGFTPGENSIPTSSFKTIMDHSGGWAADWYANGVPTAYDRGVRNCDLRDDYDTPNWQSPAPDGLGRWTWGDSSYNTGCWIETANKQGFVLVPYLCSGRTWYETSTLHHERTTAEIQVFDPNMMGQVALGTRAAWNTYPTYRRSITDDMLPRGLGGGAGGNNQYGGPAGASYDPTTQRLYVYCLWGTNLSSFILVYEVGNGNAPVKDVAIGETNVTGTDSSTGIPANRACTETADGVYETVTEVLTGGTSQLEQKWTFNVTGGSSVTFNVKAYHNSNSDGDDFVFAYSTDGNTWTNMVTVTKTADDGNFQTYTMPANTSGTVYVRVRDTDRTAGHNNLDTIYIDEMNFTSNP